MDQNGVILFIGLVLLALLVLLRNRPLLVIGRLFRGIGRPLGRLFRPLGRLFRPVAVVLRALRIIPRAMSKQGRNYVGPAAFSAIIRAFRPKTEIERELDKTEFAAQIAEKAMTYAVPEGERRTESVRLEEAARKFHEAYDASKRLLDLAFEKADGDLSAARENFKSLQEDPPKGYNTPKIFLKPDDVEPSLKAEEEHLDRRGEIFKWLEPRAGFVRHEDIEWKDAEKNYFLANIFFTYDIPSGTPDSGVKPVNLYEEIDGAFSVSMFGIRDRDVYYLFTEMRKVINGNVRRLALLFSLIAALFFLFNVYVFSLSAVPEGSAGEISSYLRNLFGLGNTVTFMGFDLPGRSKVLLISFLVSAVAMWLLYTAEYRHYVRNNGREMNNFLTRYLARINNFYRQAERNARGVFAGEIEVGTAEMEEHAQVWFGNIQWMAFRAFYVETFLRNTLYQIYRNSGYYIFLVPFIFAVGTFLLLYYTSYSLTLENIFVQGGWHLDNPASLYMVLFVATSVLLIAMVAYYLINSLSELEGTIREDEWFNFHHFALQRTTTNLIGRYGNEIKFWRERLKASEGKS